MTDSPKPESNNPEPSPEKSSFFAELKRRKVVRVAITYAVVAWVIMQVAGLTFESFGIPEWAFRFVVIMLLLGFPISLIITWAFELTPSGIKTTKNARDEQGDAEAVRSHEKKRNWTAITFAAVLPTAIFGTLALYFFFQSSSDKTEVIEPAVAESVAEVEMVEEVIGKSIAVLPFDNRSSLADDQYFTDGIHDDLLTQISRIHDIKTISRTSVMAYRGTTKNMRQIGEELGVATLLEGGVQRAGDRVRINMQLIDARTDAHLWAETYTRELTAENIFEIQSEIAVSIAAALKAVLSPEEQQQLENLPTQNLAALEAFFAGKATRANVLAGQLDESIEHFKRAIALDPQFAAAHAYLAGNYLTQVWSEGLPVEAQNAKAEPLIQRALELDPSSSEAHANLGVLYARRGELAGAEKAFKRSIELNPNDSNAYAWYGNFQLWTLRNHERAVALSRKAVDLDPVNVGWQQMYAEALFVAGNLEEAKTVLEKAIEAEPDHVEALRTYGELMANGFGRRDESARYYRKIVALNPNHPVFAIRLSESYYNIEMEEEALFWVERVQRLAPLSREAKFYEGVVYLIKGQTKEAETSFREVPEDADSAGAAKYLLSGILDSKGRYEEALALYSDFIDVEVINGGNSRNVKLAITFLHLAGQTEDAQKLAHRMLEAIPGMARLANPGYLDADAIAYMTLGEEEKALDASQALYDAGYVGSDFATSTIYEPLKEEPRFQELQEKMSNRMAEQRANLRRWEANGELAEIPELLEE